MRGMIDCREEPRARKETQYSTSRRGCVCMCVRLCATDNATAVERIESDGKFVPSHVDLHRVFLRGSRGDDATVT